MVEKRTATVLGSHVKLWAGDLRRRPQSDLASVGGEQAVFFPLLQFFPPSNLSRMKKHILILPPPPDTLRRSSRVKSMDALTQQTKRQRTSATSTDEVASREERAKHRRLKKQQTALVPPLAGVDAVVPGRIDHVYPARGTLRFAASVR